MCLKVQWLSCLPRIFFFSNSTENSSLQLHAYTWMGSNEFGKRAQQVQINTHHVSTNPIWRQWNPTEKGGYLGWPLPSLCHPSVFHRENGGENDTQPLKSTRELKGKDPFSKEK